MRLDDRASHVDFLQVDPSSYSLRIGGHPYEIELLEIENALMVLAAGQRFRVESQAEQGRRLRAAAGKGEVSAGRRAGSFEPSAHDSKRKGDRRWPDLLLTPPGGLRYRGGHCHERREAGNE